jgi:hypothetical protein
MLHDHGMVPVKVVLLKSIKARISLIVSVHKVFGNTSLMTREHNIYLHFNLNFQIEKETGTGTTNLFQVFHRLDIEHVLGDYTTSHFEVVNAVYTIYTDCGKNKSGKLTVDKSETAGRKSYLLQQQQLLICSTYSSALDLFLTDRSIINLLLGSNSL